MRRVSDVRNRHVRRSGVAADAEAAATRRGERALARHARRVHEQRQRAVARCGGAAVQPAQVRDAYVIEAQRGLGRGAVGHASRFAEGEQVDDDPVLGIARAQREAQDCNELHFQLIQRRAEAALSRRRPEPYASSAPGSLADDSSRRTLRSLAGALDRGPGPEGGQHVVVQHDGDPRLALGPRLYLGQARNLPGVARLRGIVLLAQGHTRRLRGNQKQQRAAGEGPDTELCS